MLRTAAVVGLLVVAVVPGLACKGPDARLAAQQERTKVLQSLKDISYRREGGSAGVRESLTITSGGAAEAVSSLRGRGKTQLGEFQMLQLARLFEGWEQYADDYTSMQKLPQPAAVVLIRCGQKSVTLADDAEGLPEGLARIRARLQGILQQALVP